MTQTPPPTDRLREIALEAIALEPHEYENSDYEVHRERNYVPLAKAYLAQADHAARLRELLRRVRLSLWDEGYAAFGSKDDWTATLNEVDAALADAEGGT